jgi:hypothetical protein
MSYTVTELVSDAYYLSGIVSRGFQTVSGQQSSDGIKLLNGLTAVNSINGDMIPFFKAYDFNGVIGQEKYFIPNLVEYQTFTFTHGSVRYQTSSVERKKYFGSGRVNGVNSLPYNWHIERTLGGSDLYLYFAPDLTYPMQIWGKFALIDAALGDDLLETYDLSYCVYLKYLLAEYICEFNQTTFPEQARNKLKSIELKIQNLSPPDMSIQKISMFSGKSGLTWAQVNLGNGWSPS